MRFFVRFPVVLVAASLALSLFADAGPLADHAGRWETSTTETRSFSFVITQPEIQYGINSTAMLESGSGSVRVLDPDGTEIYKHLWGEKRSQERAPLTVSRAGQYKLEVSGESARGGWRVRIMPLPPRNALGAMYGSAGLIAMIAVVLAVVAFAKGTRLAVLVAGAAMFVLGKFFWVVGGAALNIFAFGPLENVFSHLAMVWIQAATLGIWEGAALAIAIFVVARLAKSTRADLRAAIGTGIGAVTCELIAAGYIIYQGLAIMFAGGPKSGLAQFNQAYAMAVTTWLPLTEPVILVLSGACRLAAMVLILYALRARVFAPLVSGALIAGAAITAVSAARAIAVLGPESRWIAAAMCLPVAAAAIIMLKRNVPLWKETRLPNETPMEAYLREQEEGPTGS